jgi:hypothetical protein
MEFNEKEIRGINFKQLAAFTATVALLLAGYFDIRQEIHENRRETILNRELYMEQREFIKVELQLIKAQLKQVEDQQRLVELRLTVLETVVKSK